jgi:hypothetical protein
MGMFDYVDATCPQCGGSMKGQTKAGDCMLNTYTVEDEMDAHEAAIVDGETLDCEFCKVAFTVQAERARVKVKLVQLTPMSQAERDRLEAEIRHLLHSISEKQRIEREAMLAERQEKSDEEN